MKPPRPYRAALASFLALSITSACSAMSDLETETAATPDAAIGVDAAPEDAGPDVDAEPLPDATVDANADAPADASVEADAEAAPAPECTALAQRGLPVDGVDFVGSAGPRDFTGGTIADGTYVLAHMIHYTEVGTSGHAAPFGRETIHLASGMIEDVLDDAAGDERRFSGSLTITGTALSMIATCTWSSAPSTHFPELGDWQPLLHEVTAYEATTTTLTIWVPRGNHESVVRVFAKIE